MLSFICDMIMIIKYGEKKVTAMIADFSDLQRLWIVWE